MFFKKKNSSGTNPFDLDWGEITPDVYEESKNETTNVSAHYIMSGEGQKFSPIYTAGRIIWYHNLLPENLNQRVILDIRGQDEIKFNTEIKKAWGKATRDRVEAKNPTMEFLINLLF